MPSKRSDVARQISTLSLPLLTGDQQQTAASTTAANMMLARAFIFVLGSLLCCKLAHSAQPGTAIYLDHGDILIRSAQTEKDRARQNTHTYTILAVDCCCCCWSLRWPNNKNGTVRAALLIFFSCWPTPLFFFLVSAAFTTTTTSSINNTN